MSDTDKILENVLARLSGIESNLKTLVRLEEKLIHYNSNMVQMISRQDAMDKRVRELEKWRAVANVQIESSKKVGANQQDYVKSVLKWVVGILTLLLVAALSKDL